jgi:hypothetical protein
VDSGKESTDSSSDEDHVGSDISSITPGSSVEDLATTIPRELQHSLSFNSLDSSLDESCDEDFPDEFFLFPSDYGNVGLILGADDWEKIETNNSSQECLTSDDCGTTSTGIESGQGYGVNCDADSEASSHSSCHSPVPKEVASYLSCDSDNDPVIVTTSGCNDQIEESRQEDGDMNFNNHGNVDQWKMERGDSKNLELSSGCTSSVSYDDESTINNLHDRTLTSEDSVDLDEGWYRHHLTTLFHRHTTLN